MPVLRCEILYCCFALSFTVSKITLSGSYHLEEYVNEKKSKFVIFLYSNPTRVNKLLFSFIKSCDLDGDVTSDKHLICEKDISLLAFKTGDNNSYT